MSNQITAQHLERVAYIYIRQSTLQQVRHNLESHRRQYALAAQARELGFRQVVVIDEDLGISGAGNRERPGFARLRVAVCNAEAGAVFALEASRLARNNRDWHHLIDLWVLTETVVVDADGVYDPRCLNDRLLLGLKGTMSEFELGILRQRAQEASLQVLNGSQAEQDQKRRSPEMALERTRYEADRSRRQYDAVDPADRLVAAELEARWNRALVQVTAAEARLQAEQQSQRPLDENQRRRLLALGADLQALWNDPAAPVELKKRILRTVIHEMMVDVNPALEHIEMRIHWVGGVHTLLRVHKSQAGRNGNATEQGVVELVRELAQAWPDSSIAGMLNRLGYQTGPGNS
jgi:DNA invertase Pin-like site-specific DNA recombinase